MEVAQLSQLLHDPPDEVPNPLQLEDKESTNLVLDGFLRRKQLADQLEVSPRTLDRWNSLRIGPPRACVGRTILYELRAVRAWLCSRQNPFGTKPPRFKAKRKGHVRS